MAELDTARRAAERTLTGLEAMIERQVSAALEEIAALFEREFTAAALAAADPSDPGALRRLRDWWTARIKQVVAPLLAVYEAAYKALYRWMRTPPPAGADDLPGRYLDDPHDPADPATPAEPIEVPELARRYVLEAENRLAGVGDALWDAARRALADGIATGDTPNELRDRVRDAFRAGGVQLGEARAARIARTETVAAWNRAALAAARAQAEQVGVELVKGWLATLDTRTRDAHFAADGQRVALGETFTVGGVAMDCPGDPTAPPDLVINCRCVLLISDADGSWPPPDAGRQYLTDQQIAEVIKHYEERGTVRTAHTAAATPDDGQEVTAAGSYSGAMIALIPSDDDLARLALDGGEPPEQLHATLYYLGNGDDFTPEERDRLIDLVTAYTATHPPVQARAFAASAFNPGGDSEQETALVLGLSGTGLAMVHDAVCEAVGEYGPDGLPEQYEPWIPHVTLAYSPDLSRLAEVAQRVGDVTFDRVRVAFAGEATDIPLTGRLDLDLPAMAGAVRWSTPDGTALAFEDEETGDGRLFAPGALYWAEGPWPLQFADEMLGGHQGAVLAGSIESLGRDGARITGAGVLYPDRDAGAAALALLRRGAPLGVSVDLDDVDVEVIDRRTPTQHDEQQQEEGEGAPVLLASLASAQVLQRPDGTWTIRATRTVEWTTGEAGDVTPTGLSAALSAAGLPAAALSAAAGDRDSGEGEVLFSEGAGDYVMRITRARVRGATLVAMPAFDRARIVLDEEVTAAAGPRGETMRSVVELVTSAPAPVGAAYVARYTGLSVASARGYLARAAQAGWITRVSPGRYTGAATFPEEGETTAAARPGEVVAAMSGDLDLPIHPDRDHPWDGDAAASRVLEYATGPDGEVDPDALGRAFLWRDESADPATLAAYKLGVADVWDDDQLRIIPRSVFAVANVLQGGRGGVDIPDQDVERLRDRVEDLYERLAEEFDDPSLRAPWDQNEDRDEDRDEDEEGDGMDEVMASAWAQFQQLPPLPAAWFAEPSPEELPTDDGPVHVTPEGRIFGWVARKGVCHDGYSGQCLTIDSLGDVDTTHFLRSRIQLDDGQTIRVGVFTMNTGHDNDGTDTPSVRALFDNTRTVAGLVTVGTNDRGMWFSGAAAPWLSEWDRAVFQACAPSGHWRQNADGRWSLRAVLSVPVPGYPTPLAASAIGAVISRSNLALTASSAPTQEPAGASAGTPAGVEGLAAALAPELVAALMPTLVPAVADELERREQARREIAELEASLQPVRAELVASLAAEIHEGV
ncbi:phage minor head protein [Thermomonospora cellulosilytica]|uniref:2'-5' RNA ligase n=1 Tax=Thermomonospora cellulosilytica TaxID=1411118 RepID=A0A7W3RB50_9ACTN|nr:phage minor head protein [Thermomonospora cellulosilytica]MBA9005955.1 2'-5' RNA ligase [Thermomonospora cellulosilytica]